MPTVDEVKQQLKDSIADIDKALKDDQSAPDSDKMDAETKQNLEDAKRNLEELLAQIKESGEINPKDPKYLAAGRALCKVLEKLGGKVKGIGKILTVYMKILEGLMGVAGMLKYPAYKKMRDGGFQPGDDEIKGVVSQDQQTLDWYELIYQLKKAEKEAEEKKKKEEEEKKKTSSEIKDIRSLIYINSVEFNVRIC